MDSIDDRTARFYKAYVEDKKSLGRIAQDEGISRERVRQILSQHPNYENFRRMYNEVQNETNTSRQRKNLTQADKDQLRENFIFLINNEDFDLDTLEWYCDRSPEEIREVLRGTEEYSKFFTEEESPKYDSKLVAKVVTEYLSGQLTGELAEKYELTQNDIIEIILSSGEKLRSKAEDRKIIKKRSEKSDPRFSDDITIEIIEEALREKEENNKKFSVYAREKGLRYSKLMQGIYRYEGKY